MADSTQDNTQGKQHFAKLFFPTSCFYLYYTIETFILQLYLKNIIIIFKYFFALHISTRKLPQKPKQFLWEFICYYRYDIFVISRYTKFIKGYFPSGWQLCVDSCRCRPHCLIHILLYFFYSS